MDGTIFITIFTPGGARGTAQSRQLERLLWTQLEKRNTPIELHDKHEKDLTTTLPLVELALEVRARQHGQHWLYRIVSEFSVMSMLKAIHVVYANWCPHCVPTAVEPVKKKAQELEVPCLLYDIDEPAALEKADELVKKHGDWCEDYLIPQIFLEYDTGEMRHVFTGYSEDIQLTRRGLDNLLASPLLKRD